MESSFGNTFRKGFVLGLGMIIPLCLAFIISHVFTYKLSALFYTDDAASYSYKSNEEDHIKSIEVQSFHDIREGNFVMVTGSIKNTGKVKINSIKLEAEFFNEKGEFVYEETEYVSKSIKPNEVENFAIKCGCTNRTFPEYKTVTVRVVSASNY